MTRVAATFGKADWFTGEALASFYDILETRSAGASDALWPAVKEIAAPRRAGTALYQYAVAAARHDNVAAAQYQVEVRELVPEVILATGSENPKTSTAISQQDLAALRRQQEALRRQLEQMQRRLSKLSGSEENAQRDHD